MWLLKNTCQPATVRSETRRQVTKLEDSVKEKRRQLKKRCSSRTSSGQLQLGSFKTSFIYDNPKSDGHFKEVYELSVHWQSVRSQGKWFPHSPSKWWQQLWLSALSGAPKWKRKDERTESSRKTGLYNHIHQFPCVWWDLCQLEPAKLNSWWNNSQLFKTKLTSKEKGILFILLSKCRFCTALPGETRNQLADSKK